MDLVQDMYNKLHTRDEIVYCPNCRRILYIPEDLPPDKAVHKKKPAREAKGKSIAAGTPPAVGGGRTQEHPGRAGAGHDRPQRRNARRPQQPRARSAAQHAERDHAAVVARASSP